MNYNDAFANNDYQELDKLARHVNNKKKLQKSIERKNNRFEKEIYKGISCYNNDSSFNFLPINKTYNGDFVSSLPSPMEENSIETKSLSSKSNDDISINSTNLDTELSSGYSLLPKKQKKRLRLNTEHLKKYKSNDDKYVLKHIKECDECKQQLLELLKENNHIFQNQISQSIPNPPSILKQPIKQEEKTESLFSLNYVEIRNIVIIILAGILLIVLIDIFLRR